MARFRKRPVEIEAIQFTGSNVDEIRGLADSRVVCNDEPDRLAIETLEGTMTAQLGDWIIKGVAGEIYPCKPQIFEDSYEPAGSPCSVEESP